jgi:hypothetical protein
VKPLKTAIAPPPAPRRPANRAHLTPSADKRRPGQLLSVPHSASSPHHGLLLAASGQWLTLDHYWRARLRDGDVTDTTLTAPPEEA